LQHSIWWNESISQELVEDHFEHKVLFEWQGEEMLTFQTMKLNFHCYKFASYESLLGYKDMLTSLIKGRP